MKTPYRYSEDLDYVRSTEGGIGDVICLGDPFEEMEGNLVVVDYQKSRKVVR
jgi:hypothetical protein